MDRCEVWLTNEIKNTKIKTEFSSHISSYDETLIEAKNFRFLNL